MALRVVEVGGHRDDRTEQIVVESIFGPVAQRREDFGADFDRTFFTGDGLKRHHAGLVNQLIRELHAGANVGDAAPHQAFN